MSRIEQDAGDRHPMDPHFLDDAVTITVDRMLALSGLSRDELITLVEHGAFTLVEHGAFHQHSDDAVIDQWRFAGRSVLLARRAVHLRRAFELDVDATSLLIGMLERMDELQRRVRELEGQLLRQE